MHAIVCLVVSLLGLSSEVFLPGWVYVPRCLHLGVHVQACGTRYSVLRKHMVLVLVDGMFLRVWCYAPTLGILCADA